MRKFTQYSLIRRGISLAVLSGWLFVGPGPGQYPAIQAQPEGARLASEMVATPPPEEGDPRLGLQGIDCTSPVVFDDQWASGYRLVCQDHIYVVMVDLTNPAVRVDVAAASSGIRSIESYKDANTIAIINADYQFSPCSAPGEICSQGLTISNGSDPDQYTNLVHLCTDALIRREIGFSQAGQPKIDWWYKFVSDGQARSWCPGIPGPGGGAEQFSYNLVGAGPKFTFDGIFRWECAYGYEGTPGASDCESNGSEVVINEEHFGTSASNWWNRYQSVIGISTDGTTLVLGESYLAATMQAMHDVLSQRLSVYGKGLEDAFKFDGGSKAGIYYYMTQYSITPRLTVPNVVRIQRIPCYSLGTNVNPFASGSVGASPSPNCAGGKYVQDTVVQLTALPYGGYTFNNWSGGASGSANPVSVTLSADKSVTANFTPQPGLSILYMPVVAVGP